MPWSGSSGAQTYSRTDGTRTGTTVWQQAKAASVKVVAGGHDTHDQDIATALNAVLKKDGGNTATANIPMGNFLLTGLGTASSAGHSLAWGRPAEVTTLEATGAVSATSTLYAASAVTFGSTLAVSGASTLAAVSATTITASTRVQIPDGTVSVPGLRVGTSSVTGLFSSGDNSLRLASGGAEIAGAYTDRFDVAIGRIKFPAAQNASSDANTLDDYEEGTFTPGLQFGGGSIGMTFSTQSGAYTKIGNRVLFDISLNLTAKGSSTGAAVATGLPFQPGYPAFASAGVDGVSAGFGSNPQVLTNTNNTTMTITIPPTTSGSRTALTEANFTDTTQFYVSGCYKV